VSSASSDELAANNVVYIGRASFRFEPVAEEVDRDPPVTARIPRWTPAQAEQEWADYDELTRPARASGRWVVLPVWALAFLGAAAFALGLAASVAARPLAQRASRLSSPAAAAQGQPQATRALSTIVVEPIGTGQ